ncbi:hypothetical protein C0993_003649 [Termitomyces sp. T159_Od127]|nr:hypothetical protein C0993_003649 [Termitomyces sp. T159_Od127]
MSTHGLPNDVLSNLDPLALSLILHKVYPALRRAGINFSALKKITWGYYTGTAAMIWATEYAFTKAPVNMRSLVMAAFLFTSAIASAIGEAFVALSSDPLLVWNYGTMAVLASVTGTIFWIAVRKLDAKEDELNSLSASNFDAGESKSRRQFDA